MTDINLTLLINSIDKLITQATEQTEINVSRKDMASTVVGMVLGSMLQLPTEKPTNKKVYYTANILPKVQSTINSIIETVVLDIDVVMETAYLVWSSRYELLYPSIFSVKPLLQYLYSTKQDNNIYSILLQSENNDALTTTINNFANYLDGLELMD